MQPSLGGGLGLGEQRRLSEHFTKQNSPPVVEGPKLGPRCELGGLGNIQQWGVPFSAVQQLPILPSSSLEADSRQMGQK